MNTLSNLPSPAMPLVGPDGRLVPAWFQFFMSLFARTGGAAGIVAGDMQADTAAGAPIADLAPVYALLYAVEALAMQAMSAGGCQSDERGEAGETTAAAHLMTRLAELESLIEHCRADDALRIRCNDFEAQLAAGSPVPISILDISETTTTTAPSAGAAGALPATPAGYATVSISGTNFQIPYY